MSHVTVSLYELKEGECLLIDEFVRCAYRLFKLSKRERERKTGGGRQGRGGVCQLCI